MYPKGLPPHVEMMKFILGKWISKPIYVAAKLRIADILSDGPKSIEELAQMIDVHAPSLYRLMRALACLGIFCETDEGRFESTPMAACLKSDALRSCINSRSSRSVIMWQFSPQRIAAVCGR